jgi:hypothetical protein
MSSLARRTLRTTAAAAGLAALGVGLAGNAVAAPATDDARTPGPAPLVPALPPLATPLAELPNAPAVPPLPMLFVFHAPNVNTAGPSGTGVPGLDQLALPAAAPANRPAPAPVDASPVRTAPSVQTPAPQQDAPRGMDQVGALSQMDSAGLFTELGERQLVNQEGLGTSTLGMEG